MSHTKETLQCALKGKYFPMEETMNDIAHQILQIRKQCLTKTEGDDRTLNNLFKGLLQWQDDVIDQLKTFVQKKCEEIKEKHRQIYQQRIRQLDALYFNCFSNRFDEQKQRNYLQFVQNCQQNASPIELSFSKSINFNDYFQFNTNRLVEPPFLHANRHLDLTTYGLISNLSIQSNLTPLFAADDRLLIYYDHQTSSPALHLFNFKNYLKNNKSNSSAMKLRIPCHPFHGKIMHMEYCEFIKGFLLATGSKLFMLQISNTVTDYSVTESFDIVQRNFSGILQKFACHPVTPNLVYLLLTTLTNRSLVQIDLSRSSRLRKHCQYPKEDHCTTDYQLSYINDFVFGKDRLIFAVTYQSNKKDDAPSYQIHVRSLDMELLHRFPLDSMQCPLRICMIPTDYSSMGGNDQEQFLIIYQKSKILSFYHLNFDEIHEEKVQLIEEIILDTEPEYIGFPFNDSSMLILRTPFHISIYKQTNHSLSEKTSIGQRSSGSKQNTLRSPTLTTIRF